MPAPTIAASSTNKTGNTSTDLTVTFGSDGPSGIVAGSLLVASVAVWGGASDATLATPTGWNKDAESTVNSGPVRTTLAFFSKIATGAESSVVFDGSPLAATSPMSAKVHRIADGSSIHQTNVTAFASGVTTYTVNGVTTTINDCLVFYTVACGGSRDFTPNAALTEQWDFIATATNAVSQGGATLTKATAGATGNLSYNPNTTATIGGMCVAIAPILGTGNNKRMLLSVG